jgi:uncharacterized protein YvpB
MQARPVVRTSTMAFLGVCLIAIAFVTLAPTMMRVGSLSIATILQRFDRDSPSPRQSAMLPGVFTYQQQRSLSCEYASLHIATALLGDPVSEYVFDDLVPLNENPHLGYRGNILGEWGNTDDYGVYNEPLATALRDVGFEADPFYGGQQRLEQELSQGRPVVVWLGFWGDAGSFDAWSADGTRYQLTTGMHVLVAYGYDQDSVYLTDPGTAVLRQYSWGEFMQMWNVMDGMGLSVGSR